MTPDCRKADCSGPNDKIQAVIDNGVCRRIVELLMNNQQVVENVSEKIILFSRVLENFRKKIILFF